MIIIQIFIKYSKNFKKNLRINVEEMVNKVIQLYKINEDLLKKKKQICDSK